MMVQATEHNSSYEADAAELPPELRSHSNWLTESARNALARAKQLGGLVRVRIDRRLWQATPVGRWERQLVELARPKLEAGGFRATAIATIEDLWGDTYVDFDAVDTVMTGGSKGRRFTALFVAAALAHVGGAVIIAHRGREVSVLLDTNAPAGSRYRWPSLSQEQAEALVDRHFDRFVKWGWGPGKLLFAMRHGATDDDVAGFVDRDIPQRMRPTLRGDIERGLSEGAHVAVLVQTKRPLESRVVVRKVGVQ